MNTKQVVSDFDGVVGNSREIALELAQKIVSLLNDATNIYSFSDYYKLVGINSSEKIVSTSEAETISELHRILIRHNCEKIHIFDRAIESFNNLILKPIIVSSSYGDVIRNVLNKNILTFQRIYGFEDGHKSVLLKKMKSEFEFIYITDTFHDIKICIENKIPVIGVCWGYDNKDIIIKGNPTYFAETIDDLNNLFVELNLIKNGE